MLKSHTFICSISPNKELLSKVATLVSDLYNVTGTDNAQLPASLLQSLQLQLEVELNGLRLKRDLTYRTQEGSWAGAGD